MLCEIVEYLVCQVQWYEKRVPSLYQIDSRIHVMPIVELNEEEIKTLIAIMQFSIAACPLNSVSQEFEVDAEKLEKIIAKMENVLKS